VTTVIDPNPRQSLGLGSASDAPGSLPFRPAAFQPAPSRPALFQPAPSRRALTRPAVGASRRAAPKPRWRSASKQLGVVAGRTAFTVFLVLAALLFFFLAIGPRVLNYQTSTMLTGSMSPGINPGDVVVSVKTPVSQLNVGDVITYSIPIDDRRIETHRVMSIKRNDAGVTTVTTKGDANPSRDPWVAVLSEDYVYTQAGVVPYLGDLIRALRQPFVQPLILYGGSALLVAVLLTSIWGKPADSGSPAPEKDVADS
jgi:signal peptidase